MTAFTVTAVDIAALRKADAVVFRTTNCVTRLEAIKRAPDATEAEPFPRETARHIQVACFLRDYTGGQWGSSYASTKTTAVYSITSAQHCDVWQSIAAVLKAGDTVSVEWTRGNDSEAMRAAGWHHDQIALVIDRGEKRLKFIVGSEIRQGDRWRMVQMPQYAIAG